MSTHGYRWNLADLAHARGIGSAAELGRRLADHQVRLSRSQVHRMMTGQPSRLDLEVAVGLCAVLDCTLDELIDRADNGTDPGAVGDDEFASEPASAHTSVTPDGAKHTGSGPRDPAARTRNLLGAVTLELTERTERQILAATGLSPIEATAVTSLRNVADGHRIDELRAMVGLSQPGCARLVDRLAARGIVRRAVEKRDRRLVTVSLTATGRATAKEILTARDAAVRSLVAGVAQAEAAALTDGLAAIARTTVSGRAAVSDRFCRRCDPIACGFPYDCPATVFQQAQA